MADHSEAVQIDYDPSLISYEELLAIFWESHDPTWQSGSTQYRNKLFYHNDAQKELAEETRNKLASEKGSNLITDIVPLKGFTLAEDYHQKHTLRRNTDIMDEFKRMYSSDTEIMSSTAAARINGYLAGVGMCNDVKAEIENLGLSPLRQKDLLKIVCRNGETR